MLFFMSTQLLARADCRNCQAPGAFGPGVYAADFEGYTIDQVLTHCESLKKAES